MKWSLLVGRAWGTEIRLHASLLLLIPYALLAFQPQDFSSAIRVLTLIAAVFACVGLHELGHTFAARLYGIQVKSIVLWPLGGFANLSRRPEKVLHELVISAAGPLANLVIFFALLILIVIERLFAGSTALPWLARWLGAAGASSFLAGLAIANLSLAVFNMIPVYPLDGGQIARGILKTVMGEKWADRLMLALSLPPALLLTAYGLFSSDIVALLTGLLLIVAGSSLNIRLFNGMMLAVLFFIDRGGYHLKRSDFDQAVRHFSRLIERAPTRSGLYVSRAVAYMNLLEREPARQDILRALELDRGNFVAWALFGELLSQEDACFEALNAYNRAIEIRPNWSIGHLDRGILHMEQGRLDLALADINHSLDLAHGSAINHLHRSLLRYKMGEIEGAHQDADIVLRYAPHWMLVFPEVFLFNLKGHLDWALDYYWRAIESLPRAYQAYQGRADACRINDRPDWAIADYDRAIQLAPRQSELYLGRGRCFLQVGMNDRAAADFQLAARLAALSHIRRRAEAFLSQTQPGAGAGQDSAAAG